MNLDQLALTMLFSLLGFLLAFFAGFRPLSIALWGKNWPQISGEVIEAEAHGSYTTYDIFFLALFLLSLGVKLYFFGYTPTLQSLLFFSALFFVYFFFHPYGKNQKKPKASATETSLAERHLWVLHFKYRYTVQGNSYEASHYSFEYPLEVWGRCYAEQAFSPFRIGSAVTVYYHPRHPQKAALSLKVNVFNAILSLVVGLYFAGIWFWPIG
jgi:hypothetical protein